jgi:REP element-mobilizing transposase RayT
MHAGLMVRQKREEHQGAWHHVMNRGARRNKIFLSDEHCIKFLDIVGEAVIRYRLEIHAYSLMPNHYHLLAW